MSVHSVKPVTL